MATKKLNIDAAPSRLPAPVARGRDTERLAEAAFIRLLRAGVTPSVERLREEIGGGGTDLLARVIRRLRERQAELLSLPSIPDELTTFMLELWERATAAADKRFETDRKKLTDELAGEQRQREEQKVHFERQLQALQEASEGFRAQLKALGLREAALMSERAELFRQMQAKHDELTRISGVLTHTEAQLDLQVRTGELRFAQVSDLLRLIKEQIPLLPEAQRTAVEQVLSEIDARFEESLAALRKNR